MSFNSKDYTPSELRSADISSVFHGLRMIYQNDTASDKSTRMNDYMVAFQNIVNELSSQSRWDTDTNRYSNVPIPISNCSSNLCSRMQQIRKDIADLNAEASSRTDITKDIAIQSKTINKNKEMLLTRKAQYDMAVQRNEHRRKMVLTVASLNTLLLLFYYMLVSDAPTQPSTN
jgi:plasmid maintenance system antidote protein VapI